MGVPGCAARSEAGHCRCRWSFIRSNGVCKMQHVCVEKSVRGHTCPVYAAVVRMCEMMFSGGSRGSGGRQEAYIY